MCFTTVLNKNWQYWNHSHYLHHHLHNHYHQILPFNCTCEFWTGMVSYRNKIYGSWFLTAVAYVFAKYSHTNDIHQMLTKVRIFWYQTGLLPHVPLIVIRWLNKCHSFIIIDFSVRLRAEIQICGTRTPYIVYCITWIVNLFTVFYD